MSMYLPFSFVVPPSSVGPALRQLVPPPRAGLFENTANDPLEVLVRQTAEDLHFGQTRSPGQELVNTSRHIRQRRALAS
jgi:hypothetical protein